MHPHFSQKIRYIEVFTIIAILTVLSACGGATNGNIGQVSSSTNSYTETPTTVATPEPTPTDSTASTPVDTSVASPPPINKGAVSIDTNGLHIQSKDGIDCAEGYAPGHAPPNHLVLATNRTLYSPDELRQIGSYLDALSQTDETNASIDGITTPLPNSLSWASGAINGLQLCFTNMEVTNTSDSTIQILQVDARLTASPQQNNYQYRLIDACSFLSTGKCRCNECGAGGGGCSAYSADIHLGMGQQDSVFSTTPDAGDATCGQMTLAPSKTLELFLDFTPPPPPNNLMYSLITELTLNTGNGQQVLALPQLGSSVVFADKSQFSCYTLQNQTFVKANNPLTGGCI